jgi:pSer/pThr/pTyr-binding forkhead associated (FHA) protein
MQAKLVIVEPHTQPDEYIVTLPATIGRGQEATLRLTQALISRHHCELFVDQGQLMVRDLGSLNGTFVGGQRIETAPLSSGELLTVGSVTLRVVYGDNLTASYSRKGHAVVAGVDTISMEDTAQGSHRPDEDEELGELLDEGDSDPQNFFRNN